MQSGKIYAIIPTLSLNNFGLLINKLENEVKKMREGIHPDYKQVTVKCNCGNEFDDSLTADIRSFHGFSSFLSKRHAKPPSFRSKANRKYLPCCEKKGGQICPALLRVS